MDDPLAKRIHTVGRLLPHVEAKVVDRDYHSRILEIGERGELALTGYHVMKGYSNDPIHTSEAMIPDSEGKMWMRTSDEASMDPSGYISITGRIKDLIIRGGENIRPSEIEKCLDIHPAVNKVSVVGLPDERYGEVVAAFVVTAQGRVLEEGQIRAWIRKKLNHHLAPKHVFVVSSLPTKASGKMQKFKLKGARQTFGERK